MKDQLVLRVIARLAIPFILMFACYVQLHGEYSPGGGFQAGVIFASAFIVYCLIYGYEKTQTVLSVEALRIFACIGVLLYAGVGVVTMLKGGIFLDYNVLFVKPIAGEELCLANPTVPELCVAGQKLGILIIELGVGLTVFSAMLLIFYIFVERKMEADNE